MTAPKVHIWRTAANRRAKDGRFLALAWCGKLLPETGREWSVRDGKATCLACVRSRLDEAVRVADQESELAKALLPVERRLAKQRRRKA